MSLNSNLLGLIERLGQSGDSYYIAWDEVSQWSEKVLAAFLEVGILSPANNAKTLECHGCDYHCLMDVDLLPGTRSKSSRAFIACDKPDMQNKMGRISVPIQRLQQWQITLLQLAQVIAELLEIQYKADISKEENEIRVGMLKTKNGYRWVSLTASPLALVVNQYALPLEEVLYFKEKTLTIDQQRIAQLATKSPGNDGKQYTPSTSRQEQRKRDTQAMYKDWHTEYVKLKKSHPDKSNTWISKQIAKLEVGHGKSSETIRKNMIR